MAASIAAANKAHCSALFGQPESGRRRGCGAHFDNSLCWEESELESTARQLCPFRFCTDCELREEDRMATRHCQADGHWSDPDYRQCVYIFYNTSCSEKHCRPCTDSFREIVMNVTLSLSIISVAMLLTSISLFTVLKAIQCRRLTIHENLAVAFVLRFSTYTIWILLQRDQVLQGCTGSIDQTTGDWLCKIILFIIMYSTLASTFWMFVEGAYLVSRFSIYAMRATDGPLLLYLLVGWVAPLIFVLIWATTLEIQDTVHFCWMPYTTTWTLWLLVGPMSVALILNVLFLVVVIVVIMQKMRSARSTESAKIWQTIKATLLLVPLLGVSNLLLFYEPNQKDTLAFRMYLLTTAVLQHSQGIFVAVLYCFGNGEVQRALKRDVEKLYLARRFGRKESTGRRLTAGSSSADAFTMRHSDLRGNGSEKRNARKISEECARRDSRKLEFGMRGIGKINAMCTGTGQRVIMNVRKQENAAICSKNSLAPFQRNYQSCVVYGKAPLVIVTTPDGNSKYF